MRLLHFLCDPRGGPARKVESGETSASTLEARVRLECRELLSTQCTELSAQRLALKPPRKVESGRSALWGSPLSPTKPDVPKESRPGESGLVWAVGKTEAGSWKVLSFGKKSPGVRSRIWNTVEGWRA